VLIGVARQDLRLLLVREPACNIQCSDVRRLSMVAACRLFRYGVRSSGFQTLRSTFKESATQQASNARPQIKLVLTRINYAHRNTKKECQYR
jgi:hypothetical protein